MAQALYGLWNAASWIRLTNCLICWYGKSPVPNYRKDLLNILMSCSCPVASNPNYPLGSWHNPLVISDCTYRSTLAKLKMRQGWAYNSRQEWKDTDGEDMLLKQGFEGILIISILSSTHAQRHPHLQLLVCLLLLETFGTSINLDLPGHL